MTTGSGAARIAPQIVLWREYIIPGVFCVWEGVEERKMNGPYKPEIDGLRAIAVILVVFFHLSHIDILFGYFVPGGYIGVDVFFVISGYLIVPLVWTRLEDRTFTLRGFFERRMKRLLPASLVTTIVTVALSMTLMGRDQVRGICQGVVWQMGLVANWYFHSQSGYFEASVLTKPLIHTWSLAVEEQFYLFLPLILMGCYWVRRSQTLMLSVLATLGAGSFAYNVHSFQYSSDGAYFLLSGRAWEMVAGALIAFAPKPNIQQRIATAIGLLGILAILYSAVTFTETTMFPYWNALLPVGGTAIVLWIGSHSDFLRHFLSQRHLVYAGKMSYSLYLWHWPAICFAPYVFPLDYRSYGAMGVTFLASLGSFTYIESPLRRVSKVRNIIGGIVATGLCALLLVITTTVQKPVQFNWTGYETNPEDIAANDLKYIGSETGEVELLLWGDSHAIALIPAVQTWLEKRGKRGVLITRSATPPVVDLVLDTKHSLRERGPEWAALTVEYIRKHNIRHVLMASHWLPNTSPYVPRTIERILEGKTRTKVWVVMDVPCFKEAEQFGRISLTQESKRDQPDIHAVHVAGAEILDPRPFFISEDGNSYLRRKDDRQLYRDTNHLSEEGSMAAIYPLLKQLE